MSQYSLNLSLNSPLLKLLPSLPPYPFSFCLRLQYSLIYSNSFKIQPSQLNYIQIRQITWPNKTLEVCYIKVNLLVMRCVKQSLILLDNSIQVVNLILNAKRNKDQQENYHQIAVLINTAFLTSLFKGAVCFYYIELRLFTQLITKPKLLYTSVKILSLIKLQLNCVINYFKLTL